MGTAVNWESILNDAGVSICAIDIGCSGGVPYRWERLGSALHYLGIDPLEAEIDRLNRSAPTTHKFASGFVDSAGGTGRADQRTRYFFERSSAAAEKRAGFDLIKENFNHGQEVSITSSRYSAAEIVDLAGFPRVDLLKIDIDGDDFPCFRSFSKLAECQSLQTLDIESQFHGDDGPDGNTFVNISSLARTLRLDLYALDSYRYSRATLPGKFLFDFPAQTETGQVLWADAVFMRDPADASLTVEEILRQVALFYIYDLDDCAHEALTQFADQLKLLVPVEETLKHIANGVSTRGNVRLSRTMTRISRRLRRQISLLRRNIQP